MPKKDQARLGPKPSCGAEREIRIAFLRCVVEPGKTYDFWLHRCGTDTPFQIEEHRQKEITEKEVDGVGE
ncbi:unnamed protein product [Hermetia illucens]|uniref:Uncharacterized protein n=1 Tax=Hermetia illucens TaxID=343691 RepID=A0A7R8Z1G1_HERIL|nr:unnamed protein product [Hermetia illucens]